MNKISPTLLIPAVKGVNQRMIARTQDKFIHWDEVISRLDDEDAEDQAKFYDALDDPTIYAYAFLRGKDQEPFKLYAYQDMILNDAHKRIIFCAANQIGKASLLDSDIPTVDGFKKNKDLTTHDQIFGSDGKPTKILSFPYKGKRPCYKLTFDDKTSLTVAKEHLWKCKTSKQRFTKTYTRGGKKWGDPKYSWENPDYNKWITLSTEEIIKKGKYTPHTSNYNKISIPITEPIAYPIKHLPISAYILGLMLGDGCFTQSSFSSGDLEIASSAANYFKTKVYGDKKFEVRVNKHHSTLFKQLDLHDKKSKTKFIPEMYKIASIHQRTELLKGLMDTDGSFYGTGKVNEYCTISKQLKDDFVELVNSLGGIINKITVKKPFYYTKDRKKVICNDAYAIRFKIPFNPFKLDRKAKLWRPVTKYRHERLIEKIEFVGNKMTRCIEVDNEDHTYCASKNYIVTHNSVALCIKALTFAVKNPGTTTLMVSKTLPQSKDLLRQIKDFLTTSVLDYKVSIGDTATKTEIYFRHFEEYTEHDKQLDQEFNKVRELKQSRIICVPATEAALGYPVDLMLIDELAFYDDGEYFYKQIAQPRTYTTKGQIIVFSNPNGQQGIFWELWNSPRFHRYKFDFLDCPTNTQTEFDELCSDLTREQIDSTLMANFTSPEGGFLSLEERKAIQEDRSNEVPPNLAEPVYIFFDWAKAKDRTLRGVGSPTHDGKGVYVHELKEYPQGTDYDVIIDELTDFIVTRGVTAVYMVGWDNTGVGRGIEDFIKRIRKYGVICTPVEFSLENKSAIYVNFKLLVEKTVKGENLLSIPRIAECDKQLSKLRFKKSTRGHWMVHHEKESDRDDYPDCLAGLCSLIIQPETAPVTVSVIGGDPGQKQKNNKIGGVERCECGNIIDPGDSICCNCQKEI